MKSQVSLDEAIDTHDRESNTERIAKAELQQQTILTSFPRNKWPELQLNDYALGPTGTKESYNLLEYASQNLGSAKGGSAAKWIKNTPAWSFLTNLRMNKA